jgi:hypothetical protein
LVLLTALAFASSSKAAVESPPPPSVWSDKADYAPGELVTLSGANWAPGEAVHIRVNDDAGQTWSRDVDVTAADDGTISDQFNLPSSFVAVYSVTVTGASSGTATWSFTDGDIRVRAGRSPGNANTAVTIAAGNLKLFSTSDCSGTSTSSNASPFTTGGGSGNGYANPTPALNAASGTSFSVQVPSSVTVGTTTYSFASWQSDGTNATLVATSGTTGCFLSNANGQISLTANYADTVNTTTTASNASATYGDTSVTLAATVSPASGPAVNTGTVTFTVNGTPVTSGTVSGGNASATFSLSGVNAGSYNIAATYNAGSGFNASNNSTQSPAPKLTLAKADPVCAISGYDDVYDGQAHGASGSCTGVEDEVLAGLDLGDTFTNVPGGTAEWAFTDVTGNYHDDSGSVEIVISKAELTVKADNKAKDYDGSAFTGFTRTITGFASGEGESVITGSVTYGGTAVGAVNAGTYTIVPDVSGLSADNYNFTPANGTLTIGAWNAAGYGFYQPVGADAAHSIFTAAPASAPTGKPASMEWNTAKGGSTIPLKFNVYAGLVEKTSLTDTFAATPFRTVKLPACTDATSEDLVDFTTTGNTTLRYDGTAGQWIQNWKTPTDNKESCYRAWVTFADGSSIEAFFKLKK